MFTTITDTIAWSSLPRPLFLRLFRHDLSVSPLFRNFLFADRVMREAGVTPMSYPRLPPTHKHPLWDCWDLHVDLLLKSLIAHEAEAAATAKRVSDAAAAAAAATAPTVTIPAAVQPTAAQPQAGVDVGKAAAVTRVMEEPSPTASKGKKEGSSKRHKDKKEKTDKDRDREEDSVRGEAKGDKVKKSKKSGKDADSKLGKSKSHKKHKVKDGKRDDGDGKRRSDKPSGQPESRSAVVSLQPERKSPFTPTTFFEDQLQAFEVWLQGNRREKIKSPPQLPVLLQVGRDRRRRLDVQQRLTHPCLLRALLAAEPVQPKPQACACTVCQVHGLWRVGSEMFP